MDNKPKRKNNEYRNKFVESVHDSLPTSYLVILIIGGIFAGLYQLGVLPEDVFIIGVCFVIVGITVAIMISVE